MTSTKIPTAVDISSHVNSVPSDANDNVMAPFPGQHVQPPPVENDKHGWQGCKQIALNMGHSWYCLAWEFLPVGCY